MRSAHQVCSVSSRTLLASVVVCLTAFSLSGCVSVATSDAVCQSSGPYGAGMCAMGGPADAPRELRKVALPEYVIGPPDGLLM